MSSTISVRDGIKYGFGLLAYALGVGLAGGGLFFIGILLVRAEGSFLTFLGGLMVLAGFVVIYSGVLGTAYKVIADAVKVGVEEADTSGSLSNDDIPGRSSMSPSSTSTNTSDTESSPTSE
jgi:hypothetical protein